MHASHTKFITALILLIIFDQWIVDLQSFKLYFVSIRLYLLTRISHLPHWFFLQSSIIFIILLLYYYYTRISLFV